MVKFENKKVILSVGGPKRIQIGPINHLPLALLSIASWLRKNGDYAGKIKILDTQIYKAKLSDFSDAAIVGISAMTGMQIRYGLEIAALAKKANPDVLIVWGGIHPSLLPEQTIKHPLVDLIVIGEGEKTFSEVVKAFLKGDELAEIPGTCLQKNNGEIVLGPKRDFIDMDELPLPAYDLIDIKEYNGIDYQFDYQSSRGCPFRCGFCYNVTFCGRRWRKKSPDKVTEELTLLHDKYNVKNFAFVDDEFFINLKRVEAIFDGILEGKKKFGIIASCRLDIIHRSSPVLFDKMKKAGITQIFFGAESGSEKILKDIQKDITKKDIINGAKCVAEAGIRPILSFMSGFPGETTEELENTFDVILELWETHPLITVNGIFPFNPYPGSKLYEKSLDLGFNAPGSFEEWGSWAFQYEPNNPWLNPVMKQWMEIAFYMVRFRYYIARYQDRYKESWLVSILSVISFPLSVSIKIRLKKRWFRMAWEWKIFAFFTRKMFGYL